jgi:predicted enzyme related to lactoylglutathione lyase
MTTSCRLVVTNRVSCRDGTRTAIKAQHIPIDTRSKAAVWPSAWMAGGPALDNVFIEPPSDADRAINFYQQVFGWRFDLGWEYDTPQGREKYWHVITGAASPGINGGLTRREYPGQPISVAIEVPAVDACTDLVNQCGGTTVVSKVGLPGVAWFAVCQDSEGNTFAIFQPDPAAA